MMAIRNAADLMPNREMETLCYELVLEYIYGKPYSALVREAYELGVCDELDLLQLGRRVCFDLARLARKEISSIHIPNRLPRRGEYRDQIAA